MRTFIHIGQHKTATTSIQKYLESNRISYIKSGLYFPDSLMGNKKPNHFLLNVVSLNRDRFSTKKIKLLQTKPKSYFAKLPQNLNKSIERHYKNAKELHCKDIVWSNEGLYLLNSIEEYTRLKDLFSNYSNEIVVICCFRDKSSYQLSYKKQLMKNGFNLSTNSDSYRYLENDSWLLNYDNKKDMLRSVFKDKVLFLDYNPEDMITDFLYAIGYDTVGSTDVRLNKT
ncbi:MAG: hypothetical protein KDC52_15155 [Ignavibacteriae bacterium]|nr:hypothetical protein [Ignavibacteriota bacterium]